MKKKLLAVAASVIATLSSVSVYAQTVFAAKSGSGSGSSSGSANSASSSGCSIGYLVLLIAMLVLMYFMLIRPQRKQEKETKSLQDSVQIGDEIVTYGGIVGLVINTNADSVVIETGGERNKLRIKKWAIKENVTVNERIAAEEAKEKAKKKNPMALAGNNDGKKSKKKKKGNIDTAEERKSAEDSEEKKNKSMSATENKKSKKQ